MRISKLCLSSSLLLVIASYAWCDYRQLSATAEKGDLGALSAAIHADPVASKDAELLAELDRAHGDQVTKQLKDALSVRALVEGGASAAPVSPATIQKPIFSRGKGRQSANWLADAGERFGDLLRRFFERRQDPVRTPTPSLGSLQVVGSIVKGLLLLALVVFAVYGLSLLRGSWAMSKKARSAIVEEDEPDRTLDEWLELANQYEKEGKFREAVRALYLACLIRFDQEGVARFNRSETNWEHWRRIQASDRYPRGLAFERTTRAFDHVWYGYKVRGKIEVDEFRAAYNALLAAFRGKAA